MAILLDGSTLSKKIHASTKKEVSKLLTRGITPRLAILLVGDNPASKVYVHLKEKAARNVGIICSVTELVTSVSFEQVADTIKNLNRDSSVHGIIIQLPLPSTLDEGKVLQLIAPEKDIDCLHPTNLAALAMGYTRQLPPTPEAVVRLIAMSKRSIKGSDVVVIGSGFFGRQIAFHCMGYGATVTTVNQHSKNLHTHIKRADILVSAIGKPSVITGTMIKRGAVVIDVGITKRGNKVLGDIDFVSVSKKAEYLTPVPGGVGPVTVSILIENVVQAAKRTL